LLYMRLTAYRIEKARMKVYSSRYFIFRRRHGIKRWQKKKEGYMKLLIYRRPPGIAGRSQPQKSLNGHPLRSNVRLYAY